MPRTPKKTLMAIGFVRVLSAEVQLFCPDFFSRAGNKRPGSQKNRVFGAFERRTSPPCVRRGKYSPPRTTGGSPARARPVHASRRGGGSFSRCTVERWEAGAQEHQTTVKMHVIEAPSVLPWGPLFSPRDYRALRASPRIGVVRVWGRFRANLAGIAPWDAPQSVGEESVPTDSWGGRSPRPCGRAAFSVISHAFSRCGWHARGS